MASVIPVQQIVQIDPAVVSGGGQQLQLIGLGATTNTRVPISPLGEPLAFGSATAVGTYFGTASKEYGFAQRYFAGPTNAVQTPASLLYVQYPQTAVCAYLRGGSISSLTIPQLQALSGSVSIDLDGYVYSAASVNLSSATSPSLAASDLQTALNTSLPAGASFTGSIGAAVTGSFGGVAATCTTAGTVLTMGTLTSGSFWPGDHISGTDSTNSLPAGCKILSQLTGTPGGSAGATFTISAAGTPADLTSFSCTATSQYLDATVVTGLLSIGDTLTGAGVAATVVSQLNGAANGIGVYLTTNATAHVASESITATSNVLDVTVEATAALRTGQIVVGASGTPAILSQTSGSTGGIGLYSISGSPQHFASGSLTTTAPPITVVFDAVSGGMVINSGSTGDTSTAAFAVGVDLTGTACTTNGTTLTVGGTVTGRLQVGDVVTGTDSTNSLPVNTTVIAFLSGTGGAGTYELSASGSPGNLTSCTVTSTGPSGPLVAGLNLTESKGAVLSQGASATTPAAFMDAVIGQTQQWAGFTTLFNPDALGNTGNAQKLAFATWNGLQDDAYAYIAWDTDITPTQSANASSSLGQLLTTNGISGTAPFYEPTNLYHAAFVLGCGASIDFNIPNGNTTFAFRQQSGLVPAVNNLTAANNLLANGYNYYGIYKDRAGNVDNIIYKGNISGPFKTLQNYYNQIFFNSSLQTGVFQGLKAARTVPYNAIGDATIESWLLGPVLDFVSFGGIQAGVELSPAQINAVNAAAGLDISGPLQTQGWYIQVLTASAAVRNAQASPPCNVFYVTGGNVITLNVPSIAIT